VTDVIDQRLFQDLEKKLKYMEVKTAKRAIKKGVRAGANIISKAAKSRLPSSYSTLKKSIGLVPLKPKYPTVFTIMVGPRSGSVKNRKTGKMQSVKNDGWYGHIVEFGTLGSRGEALAPGTVRKKQWKHKNKGGGSSVHVRRGSPTGLKRHPFLRPAYDQTKDEVTRVAIARIWKAIEEGVKKCGFIRLVYARLSSVCWAYFFSFHQNLSGKDAAKLCTARYFIF